MNKEKRKKNMESISPRGRCVDSAAKNRTVKMITWVTPIIKYDYESSRI